MKIKLLKLNQLGLLIKIMIKILRKNACLEKGFDFEFWIYDNKKIKISYKIIHFNYSSLTSSIYINSLTILSISSIKLSSHYETLQIFLFHYNK